MKNLKDCFVNEAKKLEYRVSLINCINEHLPVDVTIMVDYADEDAFVKYLKDEQDNIFAHASGPGVEY